MTERQLPSWYPQGVNHIIDFSQDPSPYGEPSADIMAVLERRLPKAGSRIVDIAGGYGRYAIPLAEAGHEVTIVDIDTDHLEAAKQNIAKLPEEAGKVTAVLADVTNDEDVDMLGNQYDASLNLAFLYLAEPETAKGIFKRCAPLHNLGGLAVVQFSTNIERRDVDGNTLAGEDEYSYSLEEGEQVLGEMFSEAGFGSLELTTYTIHEEQPYYLHADVIVASGIRET